MTKPILIFFAWASACPATNGAAASAITLTQRSSVEIFIGLSLFPLSDPVEPCRPVSIAFVGCVLAHRTPLRRCACPCCGQTLVHASIPSPRDLPPGRAGGEKGSGDGYKALTGLDDPEPVRCGTIVQMPPPADFRSVLYCSFCIEQEIFCMQQVRLSSMHVYGRFWRLKRPVTAAAAQTAAPCRSGYGAGRR